MRATVSLTPRRGERRSKVSPIRQDDEGSFFPSLERPIGLRLIESRRFASGAVYLGFAADSSSGLG